MPVAKRSRTPGRQAAALAFAGFGAILAIVGLFVWLDNERKGTANNTVWSPVPEEGNIFSPGPAAALADFVDETGPILFADTAGQDRDVFIQHLGDDPLSGWSTFGVRPADASRECSVEWQPESETFVDACDGTVYPADGTGLPQYETSVIGGSLVVDLVPEDEDGVDSVVADDADDGETSG